MTNEYAAALEKASKAYREYDAARIAYRARKIDDAAFLKAAAAYKASEIEFDAAFAAEANR